jgi:hypothetical protein
MLYQNYCPQLHECYSSPKANVQVLPLSGTLTFQESLEGANGIFAGFHGMKKKKG